LRDLKPSVRTSQEALLPLVKISDEKTLQAVLGLNNTEPRRRQYPAQRPAIRQFGLLGKRRMGHEGHSAIMH
jgi:hypothetical protein